MDMISFYTNLSVKPNVNISIDNSEINHSIYAEGGGTVYQMYGRSRFNNTFLVYGNPMYLLDYVDMCILLSRGRTSMQ